MVCTKCGVETKINLVALKFCPKCGHPAGSPKGAKPSIQQSNNTPSYMQQNRNIPPYMQQGFNMPPYMMKPKNDTLKVVLITIASIVGGIIVIMAIVQFVENNAPSTRIVGTWVNAAGETYTFQSGGRGSRRTLVTENFTWRINGNRITMTFGGEFQIFPRTESYDIRIIGNTITFSNGTIPGTFVFTRR